MTETPISQWQPAEAAFSQFCQAHPAFGLKGTKSSWLWFRRTHGPAMERAGVLRKLRTRALMIDALKFPEAAFQYLTTPTESST